MSDLNQFFPSNKVDIFGGDYITGYRIVQVGATSSATTDFSNTQAVLFDSTTLTFTAQDFVTRDLYKSKSLAAVFDTPTSAALFTSASTLPNTATTGFAYDFNSNTLWYGFNSTSTAAGVFRGEAGTWTRPVTTASKTFIFDYTADGTLWCKNTTDTTYASVSGGVLGTFSATPPSPNLSFGSINTTGLFPNTLFATNTEGILSAMSSTAAAVWRTDSTFLSYTDLTTLAALNISNEATTTYSGTNTAWATGPTKVLLANITRDGQVAIPATTSTTNATYTPQGLLSLSALNRTSGVTTVLGNINIPIRRSASGGVYACLPEVIGAGISGNSIYILLTYSIDSIVIHAIAKVTGTFNSLLTG